MLALSIRRHPLLIATVYCTITGKMMAAVSELSMYQANAMRLESEKLQQDRILSEAALRLQSDQPPTDDAEYEWIRLVCAFMVQVEFHEIL